MAVDTYQPTGEPAVGGYDTGWTSWIVFAGVMMIIRGGLNALYGLIAVVNNESVVWTNRTSSHLDIAQRGAVHLDVGLVPLFSSIGVFSQKMRQA